MTAGQLPRRTRLEQVAAAVVSALCAVILAAGVGVVTLDVFFRYFLSNPLQWSDEVAIAVLIAITFLGAALALYRDEHLGMRVIRTALTGRWADLADGFSAWVVLAVSVCLTWSGIPLLQSVEGQTTVSGLLPASIEYYPLPVGGAIMTFFALFHVFRVPRPGLWESAGRRGCFDGNLSFLGCVGSGLGKHRHLGDAGGRCILLGRRGAGCLRACRWKPKLHGGHQFSPDHSVYAGDAIRRWQLCAAGHTVFHSCRDSLWASMACRRGSSPSSTW